MTLLPTSGWEYTFENQSKDFKDHVQGSNCYAYAMYHFETNESRPIKSIPGDIFKRLTKKQLKYTDWQTCNEAVSRIIKDGNQIKKLHKLNIPVIKKMKGNISQQEKKKCDPYYRKIVLVIETDAEKDGIPTDFHFYCQNKLPIYQIYNQKLYTWPEKNIVNPYITLNINAFESKQKILRIRKNMKDPNKISMLNNLLKNRALVNFKIHLQYIPSYAQNFIPDPWWLLDIPPGKRNQKTLKQKFCDLLEKFKSYPDKYNKLLLTTMFDATKILNKKRKPMNKNKIIGLWSHKLGHASKPLNTDGNNSLIFNPNLASRNHGGYDYDKVCCYFQVLSGWGSTNIINLNK